MSVEAPAVLSTQILKKIDVVIHPDLGGRYLPNSYLDNTLIIAQSNDRILAPTESQKTSLEQRVGMGYNVLAEVDILVQALQRSNGLEINQEARDYVLENELTAACEAVGSSHYLWSASRPWDNHTLGFHAFGTPFLRMLELGVDDIQGKVVRMPQYSFELNRRMAELSAEQWLTNSHQAKKIDNKMFLTISPYPEEVTDELASTFGYKPDKRLAKLRFEVFISGVRQTIELGVEKGSVRIFQRLAEHLDSSSDFKDSTSFLEKPILVGDSANYLDTILDLAKRYDGLLEGGYNGLQYFCGQEIKGAEEKSYEKIVERQRWVREKGQGLIEGVYNLDLELAQSMLSGVPTKAVAEALKYWVNAEDQNGAPFLDQEQLDTLKKTASSNLMTRDTAFILKKNELVRAWSIMACVLNEEKARELFGEKQVDMIQKMVESNTISTPQARFYIDQIIAEVRPDFDPCPGGGTLGSSGRQLLRSVGNLFQSSLSAVRQTLFGSSGVEGSSRTLCCTCPFCNEQVEAVIRNGTIKCPNCRRQARYTENL